VISQYLTVGLILQRSMTKARRRTRSSNKISQVVVLNTEKSEVNMGSDGDGENVVANQKKRKPRRKVKTNVVTFYYPYVRRPVRIVPKVSLKGIGSFHTVDKTRYPQILLLRQELQDPELSDAMKTYLKCLDHYDQLFKCSLYP
jgi:hypothetical protein